MAMLVSGRVQVLLVMVKGNQSNSKESYGQVEKVHLVGLTKKGCWTSRKFLENPVIFNNQ